MDEPPTSHKGLYRSDRYQSPFCSKSQVANSFEKIINECIEREWHLAISYSSHGLITPHELCALLVDAGYAVTTANKPYAHSMQGRGQVNDREEMVILGRVS
jgi:adenine-specific DNA-methyltransferase